MRKYYIDNIRILCILMLFPFHAAMCFNNFGEKFYVNGAQSTILSSIVVAVYPWWMSLLFSLAGISTVYALKKRSAGEYAKERIFKLFIPLLFGILLIIPPQTYIADVFHNGYSGGYFEHYIKFFTHFTDLAGNDGAFTPGHLWFILYLFVISMVVLPLLIWYSNREKKFNFGKINIALLAILGILILGVLTFVADISGKSVGDFLTCFLLGFFVLSNDNVLEKLKKYSTALGAVWLILIVLRCTMWILDVKGDVLWYTGYKSLEWIGILAALGLGGRFLDFKNKFTTYFSPAAFPIYFFHQTVLVIIAFFTIKLISNTALQFILITIISFVITICVYELFRRIPITRFMFGIKK